MTERGWNAHRARRLSRRSPMRSSAHRQCVFFNTTFMHVKLMMDEFHQSIRLLCTAALLRSVMRVPWLRTKPFTLHPVYHILPNAPPPSCCCSVPVVLLAFFFPLSLPFFWLGYFFVSSSSFISHLIDCCRLHFFFFFFFQLFCLERGIILIFWIPPTYCFLICVCVGNVISSVSSALSLKSIGCCRAATGIRQRDTPVVAFPDSYHQSQIRVVVYTSYIYSLTKSIYSAHK